MRSLYPSRALSLSLCSFPSVASAYVRYVDAASSSIGVPDDPNSPYGTAQGIQLALDSAVSGDIIRVAGGSFDHVAFRFVGPGTTHIDLDVQILADNNWGAGHSGEPIIEPQPIPGTSPVQYNAQFSGVFISAGQSSSTILRGLTIRNWRPIATGGLTIHPVPSNHQNGSHPRIEQCTIIGNVQYAVGSSYGGAGVQVGWNCSPSFDGCYIENNSFTGSGAAYGAGVWIYAAFSNDEDCSTANIAHFPNPYFSNCHFDRNIATHNVDDAGGAVAITCAKGIFIDCTFTNNVANKQGGAIWGRGIDGVHISGCTFTRNESVNSGGGAVALGDLAGYQNRIRVLKCAFQQNIAVYAAGLFAWDLDDISIYNNSFYASMAREPSSGQESLRGSAVVLRAEDEDSEYLFVNNLLYGHEEVGDPNSDYHDDRRCVISIEAEGGHDCTVLSVNITVASNEDRAITVKPADSSDVVTLTLANSILWGNGTQNETSIAVHSAASGTFNETVEYTDTDEGIAGNGNISSDPLFAGATNFALQSTSPCRNTGSNSYWATATSTDGRVADADLAGDPRLVGTIDMGAYEFQ